MSIFEFSALLFSSFDPLDSSTIHEDESPGTENIDFVMIKNLSSDLKVPFCKVVVLEEGFSVKEFVSGISGSSGDIIPVICKISDKTLFPILPEFVAVVVVVEVVVEELSWLKSRTITF